MITWKGGLTLLLLLLLGGVFFLLLSSRSQATPGSEGEVVRILPQKIRAIPLGKHYDFAGEAVPVDQFDIRERLEREMMINAYLHSATLMSLKRSHRYFPEMTQILKEEGMPDDLKYLAVAESGLANATSSAGAKGLWQFMEATGRAYDLEINDEVDERLHLEKATRAACRYLRSYHQKFGSWHLAASAYNMGGPRLSKEMNLQRATRFEELNLNSETSRYLFRILALKAVMTTPEAFGYDLAPDDYYPPLPPYREVEVNGPVANWGDFAREHGTHYRMLKIYNPWLIGSKLTNKSGKTYTIRVPK